uniref:Uncharacterized protein n=1 Tax=Arundo donax TaxID=35708 RepID=A0A0A8Z9U0_ARUDO
MIPTGCSPPWCCYRSGLRRWHRWRRRHRTT